MKTEQKIQKVARELFLKYGYKATTVQMIADQAGLSTGAVYASFVSKEHLFEAVVSKDVQGFFEEIRKVQNDKKTQVWSSREERVRQIFDNAVKTTRRMLEAFLDRREVMEMVLFRSEGSAYESMFQRLVDMVTDRNLKNYQELNGKPDLVAKRLIRNMSAGYVMALANARGDGFTDEEWERYIWQLIGLYLPGWLAYINGNYDPLDMLERCLESIAQGADPTKGFRG